MKGLIYPQKLYAFLSQIFVQNDRNFFLRNKIEENVAKHLIYGCSAQKNH
jgi:hypothetical protein